VKESTPAPRFLSLRDAMVGAVRPALLAVMSAALLVLAITCTNIAGLFLARASQRRRELAVRAALGAGRARLMRQLLTETVLYGIGGGVLGVAIAVIVHPVIVRFATSALPALGEIKIDFALIATSFAVALICGVVVGVMPAITATRVDLRQSMGDGARGASGGGERMRVRQLLVASQITLAVLLVVGAGLLLRSFARVVNTPLGYSTGSDVLVFSVTAPESLTATPESRAAFFGGIVRRVHGLPGVANVAMTWIGPWNGPNNTTIKSIGSGRAEDVKFLTATDEYFSTIGTRVLRGRSFSASDRPGSQPVALLSESAARALFGNTQPNGQRVIVDTAAAKPDPGHEVIGVVEDFRDNAAAGLDASIYVSDWQDSRQRWTQFIVRTNGDASRLVPSLRTLMRELTPESPLMYPRTMRDLLHESLAPQQLSLSLFGVFAALALALAALGIYGVMSYVVATRTREFGIRTALGARRGTIVSLVLGQGMKAAVVGVIAGSALAFAGARVMSKLLVGVSPRDPLTFIAAPALLLAIALIACAVPARRATRIDPLEALRAE
jgi:putative ABC transport system permease protein